MKRKCIVCREHAAPESFVCRSCLGKIYPVEMPVCRVCGIDLISELDTCLRCRDAELPGIPNVSLYHYRGVIPFLISELKNRKNRSAAMFFARVCADVITGIYRNYTVIPVPCRPENKKKRGYDQLSFLSGMLEKNHGINVLRCLRRKRGAKSQKLLNREERKNNMKGKIIFRGQVPDCEGFLLLDDVYTTGATIAECASVLKQQGISEIRSLTIARD